MAAGILSELVRVFPAAGARPARRPRRLVDVLSAVAKSPAKPLMADAVEELCLALSDPSFDLSRATDLLGILVMLNRCHPREGLPQDVLAAVQTAFVSHPASIRAGRGATRVLRTVVREDLLTILRAKLKQKTPEWAVFISLVRCYGLERTRDVLAGWLPSPREMLPGGKSPEWLKRAREILGEWLKVLSALHASSPHANIGPDWLEIPEDIRNNSRGETRGLDK